MTNQFAYAINYDREIKQDEENVQHWDMIVAFMASLPKAVAEVMDVRVRQNKLDPTDLTAAFLQTGHTEAQTAEGMGLTVEELRCLCDNVEIEGIGDPCWNTPAYRPTEKAAMAKLGWMFDEGYYTLKQAKKERAKAVSSLGRHKRNKTKYGK